METATAILCACLATYRPLLSGLRIDFSRYLSSRSKKPSTHSGVRVESNNSRGSRMKWPIARDLRSKSLEVYHDFNAKATVGSHVINIDHISQTPVKPDEAMKSAVGYFGDKHTRAQVSAKEIESTESRASSYTSPKTFPQRPGVWDRNKDIAVNPFV